jgi:hypothetical protein
LLYPTSPWKYAFGTIEVGFVSHPVGPVGGSDASFAFELGSPTTSWPELPSPAEASSSSSPENETGISVGSSEVLVLDGEASQPSAGDSPAARGTPRVSRAPARNARRGGVEAALEKGRAGVTRAAGLEEAENNDGSVWNVRTVARERGRTRQTRSALIADMLDARREESERDATATDARVSVWRRARVRGEYNDTATRPRTSSQHHVQKQKIVRNEKAFPRLRKRPRRVTRRFPPVRLTSPSRFPLSPRAPPR